MKTIKTLNRSLIKYADLPWNDFIIINNPRILFDKSSEFTKDEMNDVIKYVTRLTETVYKLLQNELSFLVFRLRTFIEIHPSIIFEFSEQTFYETLPVKSFTYDRIQHKLFQYKGNLFDVSEQTPDDAMTSIHVLCSDISQLCNYIPSTKYIGQIYFARYNYDVYNIFKTKYVGPIL